METILRLKVSDLDISLLNAIKSFFRKEEEVEIQINSKPLLSVLKQETLEECNARIEKAYDNLKKKRNRVCFTGEEFLSLTQKLSNK